MDQILAIFHRVCRSAGVVECGLSQELQIRISESFRHEGQCRKVGYLLGDDKFRQIGAGGDERFLEPIGLVQTGDLTDAPLPCWENELNTKPIAVKMFLLSKKLAQTLHGPI